MDAKAILAIPLTRPDKLFDQDDVNKRYKALAMIWHPDRKGGNAEVMAHITALKNEANSIIQSGGEWPGVVDFDGATLHYRIARPFALGQMYIADRYVGYRFDSKYPDLYRRMAAGPEFRFPDDKMKKEHARSLPAVRWKKGLDLILHKGENHLCLRDVLNYFHGIMPVEHVVWILSSLYNLNCYLQWADIIHTDVSLDTYFVDTVKHHGMLLGGWEYHTRGGERMSVLPSRTAALCGQAVKTKIATLDMTGTLIRALGRELLGDPIGNRLQMSTLPKPFVAWLRGPAMDNAYKEYSAWVEMITKSFGVRRYVKLELSSSDVYKD